MILFIPIEIGLKPKILIVINLILKLKELNLNFCINSLKKFDLKIFYYFFELFIILVYYYYIT
jgi:hypothetical protein